MLSQPLASFYCKPLQVVVLKESDEVQNGKHKDVFLQAVKTVRNWLLNTFSNRLLINAHSYTSFTNVSEIEVGSFFHFEHI